MIPYDLHIHSLMSDGLHSLLEIVSIAKKKKAKGFCITEHGPALGYFANDSHGMWFSNDSVRFPAEIDGIIFWRGMEANLIPQKGDIDVLPKDYKRLDILAIGSHCYRDSRPEDWGKEEETIAMIEAIKKHPIDIVAHPYLEKVALDMAKVLDLCVDKGIAIELNNRYISLDKVNQHELEVLMIYAKENPKLRLVEGSDGHTFTEMFEDGGTQKIMKKYGIKNDRILNRDKEQLMEFVRERKELRQKEE